MSQPQPVLRPERPEPPQQHRRLLDLTGQRPNGAQPMPGMSEASRWWLMITRLVRGQ
ncbi:MAG: hypothetical protein ACFNVT_10805 [Corynebacterium matruchotii]|uniref:hypothetical protein n=1 Tax=Corynebacterium matruchotii TaxID=43768 RepID=UPI0028ED11E6|nr:hypothetical protein [Corynebacterium matruchotii]